MLTFSTKHEERAPKLFVIRIQAHRGDQVVYSRDAAFYGREDGKWMFGAVTSDGKIETCPLLLTLPKARKLAEKTAELMWKADVASKRVQ